MLGGASIFGGRGSFIGAVLGAALIVQITTVVQFLELVDYWQQYLLGALTIIAAGLLLQGSDRAGQGVTPR